MDSPLHELHTVRDFIRWGASRFNEAELFFGHGTDNALTEAAVLVLHVLHLPIDLEEGYLESNLTKQEKLAALEILQARIERCVPAAYLTNEAWFGGLSFYVNEHVLVPRSPIAETIEQAFIPWIDPDEIHHVLDIGTGSACIPIALATTLEHVSIDAVDISADALAVARQNVEDYGLSERIRLLQGDVFEPVGEQRYDLIISNPPYVSQASYDELPSEYHQEPALGLVAGDDGLDIVRNIMAGVLEHLNEDGHLLLEVGESADTLLETYPDLEFTWLEFERGGDGVFLISADQLAKLE
ncbi:MAG: 50S ribosomal protein L3 N(5)-glutamine methyltransferase [Pseudomonadota bacterium]